MLSWRLRKTGRLFARSAQINWLTLYNRLTYYSTMSVFNQMTGMLISSWPRILKSTFKKNATLNGQELPILFYGRTYARARFWDNETMEVLFTRHSGARTIRKGIIWKSARNIPVICEETRDDILRASNLCCFAYTSTPGHTVKKTRKEKRKNSPSRHLKNVCSKK